MAENETAVTQIFLDGRWMDYVRSTVEEAQTFMYGKKSCGEINFRVKDWIDDRLLIWADETGMHLLHRDNLDFPKCIECEKGMTRLSEIGLWDIDSDRFVTILCRSCQGTVTEYGNK